MVLVLHVAFKAVAFAVYEFGGLAAGMGYAATFIAVTLLLRRVQFRIGMGHPEMTSTHMRHFSIPPTIEKYLKFADNTAKILQTEGYKSKTFCGRHI